MKERMATKDIASLTIKKQEKSEKAQDFGHPGN
jgi:hypothetical protein